MNLEKSTIEQHGLMVALMLWATACGGTASSGTGSAGVGGTGIGGTGAGGTGVAGTGAVCNVACPAILCDGAPVTKPGECCPTCVPSGSAGTGGRGGSEKTAVDASSLFGAVVAPCVAGYEHPNICCQGAAYKATVCNEDLTEPFAVCDAGQLAYPDPTNCCSLTDKEKCVQPAGANSPTDAGPSADCQNPCAPGAYSPSKMSVSPDGAQLDGYLCCFGTGLSCQPQQPSCSLCTTVQAWCSTPCPADWSTPVGGEVDACCQIDAGGVKSCFSQAGYINSLDSEGSGYSTASSCIGEHFADDGNSYVMKCDFANSPDCTCLINGVVAQTVSDDSRCIDLSACGFPP